MHVPVLAGPALEWLAIREDGCYVDCTAGAGGHSELIAARLQRGRLYSLDRDPEAIAIARERLAQYPQVEVIQSNYDAVAGVLADRGVTNVDGILIDAGFSSAQLDDATRGLSFQEDGPLDMRLDRTSGEPASVYLRHCGEHELETVLKEYGDVRPARRIARQITADAASGQLHTTFDLVRSIRAALPFVKGMPEEVRTVFQAIRIAVNGELSSLARCLDQSIELLRPGGRIVAIAFHSGEDRVVKRAFQGASRPHRELTPEGRVRFVTPPRLKVLTPKPVQPDAAECDANPRSRSAKLRVAERLHTEE